MGILHLEQAVLLCCGIFFLYATSLAIYRLYLHPLAGIPGPKLAALTRYYEAYFDICKRGIYTLKIGELHEEYGPIVRISPYEVHVNDPRFQDTLYRQDGRWEKYQWTYEPLGNSASMHGTMDHDIHRMRRAALNPFFSKQRISTATASIQTQIGKLSSRLDGFVVSGKVANIGAAYSALTMDIVTDYVLEKSYGNLDCEDFNFDFVTTINNQGGVWRVGKHLRWFSKLFFKAPLWAIRIISPSLITYKVFLESAVQQAQKLVSADREKVLEEKQRKTVFHEVLSCNVLPPSEKTVERLSNEVRTLVAAGSETTANVLRVATFHLATNPSMAQRLRNEIQSVQPDAHTPATWRQLEQLPYLTGVAMESIRLSYGVSTRLPRISPNETLVYEKYAIPPGTPISMSNVLLLKHKDIYDDPDAFRPERWLDPVERRRQERYFHPFSKGTRNCLGMHLAWAELYLTLAALYVKFDFSLHETLIDDIEMGSDQFTPAPKSRNGVRVTLRRVN